MLPPRERKKPLISKVARWTTSLTNGGDYEWITALEGKPNPSGNPSTTPEASKDLSQWSLPIGAERNIGRFP
jgi:hypothetical protein